MLSWCLLLELIRKNLGCFRQGSFPVRSSIHSSISDTLQYQDFVKLMQVAGFVETGKPRKLEDLVS